jgi:hypothetical protein
LPSAVIVGGSDSDSFGDGGGVYIGYGEKIVIDFADGARTTVAREQDIGVAILVEVGGGDGTTVNTSEGDVSVSLKPPLPLLL